MSKFDQSVYIPKFDKNVSSIQLYTTHTTVAQKKKYNTYDLFYFH